MKANKNSLHARLYRFTYKSELPSNLCPYFWSLVIGIILFIPNLIMQLPSLLISIFNKSYRQENCDEKRGVGLGIYVVTLIASLIVFVNYHLISYWFNAYSYDNGTAFVGGMVDTVIITVTAIIVIKDKWENRPSRYEEKQPSIVTEFVKAKMGKYCPKIDWE